MKSWALRNHGTDKLHNIDKGIFVFITVFIVVSIFTSCKVNDSSFKTIQADSFTVSVPKDWESETKPEVIFKKGDQQIGGISVLGYYPTEPISQLYGNHYEVINSEKINTLSIPAMKVTLRRTQPAATGDLSFVDELHYFFIPEDSKVAYDLNFDSSLVDHNTAESITESFKLEGSNGNSD